jgi:hypothetical protein
MLVGWLPTRVDYMIKVEFDIRPFRASVFLEELGVIYVSFRG